MSGRCTGDWGKHHLGPRALSTPSRPDPTDPVTVYGKTMVSAEQLLADWMPEACTLRISLPMGVSFNGHAGAIDWIQSRFKKGRPATLYFDEVRTPAKSLPKPRPSVSEPAPGKLVFQKSEKPSEPPTPATRPLSKRDLAMYAGVAALGDKIYVAGGLTTSGETAAVYVFDPATSSVRRIASLPSPVAHAPLASLGGRLYLFAGQSVLQIDPATGGVRRVASLPRALGDANAITLGGRIIVLGGGTDAVYAVSEIGTPHP